MLPNGIKSVREIRSQDPYDGMSNAKKLLEFILKDGLRHAQIVPQSTIKKEFDDLKAQGRLKRNDNPNNLGFLVRWIYNRYFRYRSLKPHQVSKAIYYRNLHDHNARHPELTIENVTWATDIFCKAVEALVEQHFVVESIADSALGKTTTDRHKQTQKPADSKQPSEDAPPSIPELKSLFPQNPFEGTRRPTSDQTPLDPPSETISPTQSTTPTWQPRPPAEVEVITSTPKTPYSSSTSDARKPIHSAWSHEQLAITIGGAILFVALFVICIGVITNQIDERPKIRGPQKAHAVNKKQEDIPKKIVKPPLLPPPNLPPDQNPGSKSPEPNANELTPELKKEIDQTLGKLAEKTKQMEILRNRVLEQEARIAALEKKAKTERDMVKQNPKIEENPPKLNPPKPMETQPVTVRYSCPHGGSVMYLTKNDRSQCIAFLQSLGVRKKSMFAWNVPKTVHHPTIPGKLVDYTEHWLSYGMKNYQEREFRDVDEARRFAIMMRSVSFIAVPVTKP